jgi:hypothetical protein
MDDALRALQTPDGRLGQALFLRRFGVARHFDQGRVARDGRDLIGTATGFGKTPCGRLVKPVRHTPLGQAGILRFYPPQSYRSHREIFLREPVERAGRAAQLGFRFPLRLAPLCSLIGLDKLSAARVAPQRNARAAVQPKIVTPLAVANLNRSTRSSLMKVT